MKPTVARRPQLTLDELHHLKWLLGGLLTLVGLATVMYMDIEAWSLMAITGAAALATMGWPRLPSRLPGVVHLLAFPLIVAFFAADIWLKAEVLPAMVRLDILLLLYRNISYRQRRDDLQIIVLGLFLVIVAGVLTVSLTFAAQILVYTAVALALLLVVTLTDSVMGAAPRVPTAPGETPAWVPHANALALGRRLRAVVDWRVAGLGLVLFVGVVGVSALLFLAIPRFQIENSMFLDRFVSKKSKSGFSDVVRLGEVTDIQQDNSVALSVDVSDQRAVPAAPYWRMLVLNHYENGLFRASPAFRMGEFAAERTDARVRGFARPAQGEAVYWTFYLESGVSRFLPLLGNFQNLVFREVQNFRFAQRLALVALRDEPVSMTAYRVETFEIGPAIADRAFAARWRGLVAAGTMRDEMQARLNLAESDRQVLQQVLAEVTGGEKLPVPEWARRTGEWLRRNHSYSLASSIPRGTGDPIVRWMVSREPGHCELYAGSLVLLARAAGLPAPVVTGFRGGTWNGYSNNFTIRNSDAHAWTEIFDEDSGSWQRADPLAMAETRQAEEVRGEAAVASRLDRSWTARLDSLRVFWYRRIVNFDQRSQAATLKAVKDATQSSGRRLREALSEGVDAVKAWLAAPWSLPRILRVATLPLGVVALAWLWREFGKARWRAWRGPRGARRDDPVRREAGYWLRQLAESRAVAGEADGVVDDLRRVRFGARHTWAPPEKTFRRARQALRAARRRARLTRS